MSQQLLDISLGGMMAGRVLPPEMVSDLRRVAEFTNDQVQGIAERIRAAPGVLTDDQVIEIVSDTLSNEDDVVAAARTVRNITPNHKSEILQTIEQWRRREAAFADLFPEHVFVSLKANLDHLVAEVPSLKLMHKAHRLLRDVGNELQNVLFVCDARPVYDEDHTQVEGFVSLVNLRMGVTLQNGDESTYEVALTEDELILLINRGMDALEKLQVLQEAIGDISANGGTA